MLKALKYRLLLITFVSSFVQLSCCTTNSVKNSDIDNELIEECKELFIDVAQIEFIKGIINSIGVITHELGHVIAAKSLWDIDEPIQIHIGTRTPKKTSPLFSFGNMHFYKNMPWKEGITVLSEKFRFDTCRNVDLGIMSAAGGLTASALMYGLLAAITGYCAYCDDKNLSEITLKSFLNASSPFSYILNTKVLSYKQKRFLINATFIICLILIFNIFYGCTPFRKYGDGMQLWNRCMGVSGIPLKIVRILSTLGVWSCWIMLIKEYYEARKKLSPKDSNVSIIIALVFSRVIYYQIASELDCK